MPVFPHEYLRRVAFHIYRAEGVSEKDAHVVATHQVKANLVGHDSHGVILIPTYVERIHLGHIMPGAPFEVTDESCHYRQDKRPLGSWVRGDREGHAHGHRKG